MKIVKKIRLLLPPWLSFLVKQLFKESTLTWKRKERIPLNLGKYEEMGHMSEINKNLESNAGF